MVAKKVELMVPERVALKAAWKEHVEVVGSEYELVVM